MFLGLLVAGYFVWHLVVLPLVPFIILGAIVYGAYHLFGRKSLGGGRRTLP